MCNAVTLGVRIIRDSFSDSENYLLVPYIKREAIIKFLETQKVLEITRKSYKAVVYIDNEKLELSHVDTESGKLLCYEYDDPLLYSFVSGRNISDDKAKAWLTYRDIFKCDDYLQLLMDLNNTFAEWVDVVKEISSALYKELREYCIDVLKLTPLQTTLVLWFCPDVAKVTKHKKIVESLVSYVDIEFLDNQLRVLAPRCFRDEPLNVLTTHLHTAYKMALNNMLNMSNEYSSLQ